jgi:hypothetical protein
MQRRRVPESIGRAPFHRGGRADRQKFLFGAGQQPSRPGTGHLVAGREVNPVLQLQSVPPGLQRGGVCGRDLLIHRLEPGFLAGFDVTVTLEEDGPRLGGCQGFIRLDGSPAEPGGGHDRPGTHSAPSATGLETIDASHTPGCFGSAGIQRKGGCLVIILTFSATEYLIHIRRSVPVLRESKVGAEALEQIRCFGGRTTVLQEAQIPVDRLQIASTHRRLHSGGLTG